MDGRRRVVAVVALLGAVVAASVLFAQLSTGSTAADLARGQRAPTEVPTVQTGSPAPVATQTLEPFDQPSPPTALPASAPSALPPADSAEGTCARPFGDPVMVDLDADGTSEAVVADPTSSIAPVVRYLVQSVDDTCAWSTVGHMFDGFIIAPEGDAIEHRWTVTLTDGTTQQIALHEG